MSDAGSLRELVAFIRDVDELFDRHFGSLDGPQPVWEPAIDLFVDDRRVHVLVELPGVTAGDFTVRVGRRVVIVSGLRRRRLLGPVQLRFFESEIPYGAFRRQVRLPVPIAPASFEIGFDNGILSLSFAPARGETREIYVE